MNQETITRKDRSGTLMRTVYHTLKEEICTGVIRSGDLLSEANIAARIGVSRTPVREALAALENEGLVEIKRGIGANVKPLSFSDIVHIYELRRVLEPLAAQTAIYHITRDELKECRKQFKNLLKYQDEPREYQAVKYTEVDWNFHMLLINRCENPYIDSMMNLIIPNIRRLQILSYRPENYPLPETIDQHMQLIDVLEQRDIDQVRAKLESHLNWSLAGFVTSNGLL